VPTLFRYFWFVCAAVMVANVMIWRRRLAVLVAQGTLTPKEAARFTRGAVLWLVTPCVVLGLIALSAGWSNPICGGMLSFHDAPSAATSAVILGSWTALLGWVWLGRGADVLGRIGPVLTNRPRYDHTVAPAAVRVSVTAMILVAGLGGSIAWHLVLPHTSPNSCAFHSNAGQTHIGKARSR
jgi:hypothetical protein